MKNKLFGLLFKRKNVDVSGRVIYGRKRQIDVAVNAGARKLHFDSIGKKEESILSNVKGLNVFERKIYSNKISMIRRSQRESVQSRNSCLEWDLARKLF